METLAIIVLVILSITLICLGISRNKRIKLLEREEVKYMKYNETLLREKNALSNKNLELYNSNVNCNNVLSKQDIINKIIILIVRQLEYHLLKHLGSTLSNTLEKPKSFNLILLPQNTGIEIKALTGAKDKEVPRLNINIDSMLFGIEVLDYISLSNFINNLQQLEHSRLEILYRAIFINISKINSNN